MGKGPQGQDLNMNKSMGSPSTAGAVAHWAAVKGDVVPVGAAFPVQAG